MFGLAQLPDLRGWSLGIVFLLAPLAVACHGGGSSLPTPGKTDTQVPAFTILAGRADGSFDIERFMPEDVTVATGQPIEWSAQGFEGHTITFADDATIGRLLGSYLLPDPQDAAQHIFNPEIALRSSGSGTIAGAGTYTNSGFIGVPEAARYRLTFSTPGTYKYLCLVHPFTMRGTVTVSADGTTDSASAVDDKGRSEFDSYLAQSKQALADAQATPPEPQPDGSSLFHVTVGITTPYGQAANFVSPATSINAGDSVIFENDPRDFHTVVFPGSQPEPPGITLRQDPDGRGFNYVLDKGSNEIDPASGGFDTQTFLSSGPMGILQPRMTWQVTFRTPGTYRYACTIHNLPGMAGVITVR